jgi:hypothetical protein
VTDCERPQITRFQKRTVNAGQALSSANSAAAVVTLPSQARDGLARVWLEILKEKHPGVSWLLVSGQGREPEAQALAEEPDLSVSA